MLTNAGGSRAWTKTVKTFIAMPGNQVCWLRFPRCTIRAQTIDHYHPRKTHPHLSDAPSNWRPACLYCNRARRDTPVYKLPELRARLQREAQIRTKPPKALGLFK